MATSQAVSIAQGKQAGFDLGGIAMGAVGGAVGGAQLFGGNLIVNAVGGNILTQGVGIATGQQKDFNWSSVASAGIAARGWPKKSTVRSKEPKYPPQRPTQ